jgi:hypothetical protein
MYTIVIIIPERKKKQGKIERNKEMYIKEERQRRNYYRFQKMN